MPSKLFVNLPVADLPRSVAFYTGLGFTLNPRFTNEQAACIVVSEHIYVMLLVKPFFQGFTHLPVADPSKATAVLNALDCASREEVKALVAKALAAGGTTPNPVQDHGFMLQHGFADPDGHQWEVFYMDEAAAPQQF
ncbi:MAG: VOC family protein [Hydrogenophaga sp.]|uniref:VOC family protein n=1 Tax=Hydrogenophaga sp. TaxID=1904254 RepID=UPI001DB7E01D|nr:VOC family protein [Hydrogenophaga sp.]MBX3611554.1 VOC family protein [Hydrogenophaga sp.]